MKNETKCLHSGYQPKEGAPGVMPIVQSTTYVFDSTQKIGDLFDMPTQHMYSRFSNPTVEAVEKKIADLEGGVGAICTSSGQAATLLSILNLCDSGDSFISTSSVYGGTVNLFATRLRKLGIECIFVDVNASEDEINKAFKSNTKAVFGEVIANPSLAVLDIEKFAKVAHSHQVPLIVDSTFATPILCKPIEFGADIVIHSTSKYMDGHALQVGGVIVDSGNFDWEKGNYRDFIEDDDTYHGINYIRDFGNMAYIAKLRMQLMRDFGSYPSAHSAFLLNIGLETLALRMKQYCENATRVADFLVKHEKIESVSYPGLKDSEHYHLVEKYLPNGTSGVISFILKGGREAAVKFMDHLKLVRKEVHVADIRSCVLHPASATHRQLTDEQLKAAGINDGLIRFSVGLENIEDILEALKNALEQ